MSQLYLQKYQPVSEQYKGIIEEIKPNLQELIVSLTSIFVGGSKCMVKTHKLLNHDPRIDKSLANWHNELQDCMTSFRKRFGRLIGDLKYFIPGSENQHSQIEDITRALKDDHRPVGDASKLREEAMDILSILKNSSERPQVLRFPQVEPAQPGIQTPIKTEGNLKKVKVRMSTKEGRQRTPQVRRGGFLLDANAITPVNKRNGVNRGGRSLSKSGRRRGSFRSKVVVESSITNLNNHLRPNMGPLGLLESPMTGNTTNTKRFKEEPASKALIVDSGLTGLRRPPQLPFKRTPSRINDRRIERVEVVAESPSGNTAPQRGRSLKRDSMQAQPAANQRRFPAGIARYPLAGIQPPNQNIQQNLGPAKGLSPFKNNGGRRRMSMSRSQVSVERSHLGDSSKISGASQKTKNAVEPIINLKPIDPPSQKKNLKRDAINRLSLGNTSGNRSGVSLIQAKPMEATGYQKSSKLGRTGSKRRVGLKEDQNILNRSLRLNNGPLTATGKTVKASGMVKADQSSYVEQDNFAAASDDSKSVNTADVTRDSSQAGGATVAGRNVSGLRKLDSSGFGIAADHSMMVNREMQNCVIDDPEIFFNEYKVHSTKIPMDNIIRVDGITPRQEVFFYTQNSEQIKAVLSSSNQHSNKILTQSPSNHFLKSPKLKLRDQKQLKSSVIYCRILDDSSKIMLVKRGSNSLEIKDLNNNQPLKELKGNREEPYTYEMYRCFRYAKEDQYPLWRKGGYSLTLLNPRTFDVVKDFKHFWPQGYIAMRCCVNRDMSRIYGFSFNEFDGIFSILDIDKTSQTVKDKTIKIPKEQKWIGMELATHSDLLIIGNSLKIPSPSDGTLKPGSKGFLKLMAADLTNMKINVVIQRDFTHKRYKTSQLFRKVKGYDYFIVGSGADLSIFSFTGKDFILINVISSLYHDRIIDIAMFKNLMIPIAKSKGQAVKLIEFAAGEEEAADRSYYGVSGTKRGGRTSARTRGRFVDDEENKENSMILDRSRGGYGGSRDVSRDYSQAGAGKGYGDDRSEMRMDKVLEGGGDGDFMVGTVIGQYQINRIEVPYLSGEKRIGISFDGKTLYFGGPGGLNVLKRHSTNNEFAVVDTQPKSKISYFGLKPTPSGHLVVQETQTNNLLVFDKQLNQVVSFDGRRQDDPALPQLPRQPHFSFEGDRIAWFGGKTCIYIVDLTDLSILHIDKLVDESQPLPEPIAVIADFTRERILTCFLKGSTYLLSFYEKDRDTQIKALQEVFPDFETVDALDLDESKMFGFVCGSAVKQSTTSRSRKPRVRPTIAAFVFNGKMAVVAQTGLDYRRCSKIGCVAISKERPGIVYVGTDGPLFVLGFDPDEQMLEVVDTIEFKNRRLVTDISIYEDKLFLASDNKSESSIVEIRLDDAA